MMIDLPQLLALCASRAEKSAREAQARLREYAKHANAEAEEYRAIATALRDLARDVVAP